MWAWETPLQPVEARRRFDEDEEEETENYDFDEDEELDEELDEEDEDYDEYDEDEEDYEDYDDLENDFEPKYGLLPLVFGNQVRGNGYGGEVYANLNPVRRWRISGGYSYLGLRLSHKLLGQDPVVESIEDGSPRHQFQFHSYLNLPGRLELDGSLYHVSSLAGTPSVGALPVPGYNRLDLRAGWKARENFELSLGLQNLLDDRHPDCSAVYASEIVSASMMARSRTW